MLILGTGALNVAITAADQARSPQELVGDLVAEWCGPNLLIRHGAEDAHEVAFLATLPVMPSCLLVLASAQAHRHGQLHHAIAVLLRSRFAAAGKETGEGEAPEPRPRAVWLGVAHLGRSSSNAAWLRSLSSELRIDLIAPDGVLSGAAGAGLYAGSTTGATGWRRFRPAGRDEHSATRYPVPCWEAGLPRDPISAAGLIAEPVPAGLAVRAANSKPFDGGDLAFSVAMSPEQPKVIVGRPGGQVPDAAAMAELLEQLSPEMRARSVLAPAVPDATDPEWLARLARKMSVPVATCTGLQAMPMPSALLTIAFGPKGRELFRPFPTVVRQRPDGGGQEVLDIAPAPQGWVRSGPAQYAVEGDETTVADVVPSGLVLRSRSQTAVDTTEPFDPRGWTLTVGVPGAAVEDQVLTALEQLLGRLRPVTIAVGRISVAGELDDACRARLMSIAGNLGVTVEPPRSDSGAAPSRPAASQPAPKSRRKAPAEPAAWSALGLPPAPAPSREQSPEPGPAAAPPQPAAAPPQPAAAPPQPAAAPPQPAAPLPDARPEQPIMTVSSAPVPTMSGPIGGSDRMPSERSVEKPVREPGAEEPAENATADHPRAETRPAEPVEKPVPRSGPSGEPTVKIALADRPADQLADHLAESPTETIPRVEEPPASSEVEQESPAADEPLEQTRVEPVVIADRSSTEAEQAQFAADAGKSFTDALATVNAALATWPGLRREESAGAKADYVAVCLYLGRGKAGAVPLNEALRAGSSAAFDGYLPCLVSGIRRLPTHRRALLRQGRLGDGVDEPYPAGTLLTEPGFVSASAELDVTVDGADFDVLIWPQSARRTAELGLNRPIEEAIFLAGPRFKSLAVRTAESGDTGSGPDTSGLPRVAVLVRELSPDERPGTSEVDSRDQAALAKLERAWKQRLKRAVRVVDDPDLAARLTAPLMAVTEFEDRRTDAAPAGSELTAVSS